MAERVTFHQSLYLPEAVEAAAALYAEYARIELTTEADAVTAVVSEVAEHDPRTVINAFCNHVLHETIARRRRATLDEVA
jgi:hypothetical protein